nr:PAS domain-containing sensor histidine kinase [Pseudovibrio flavus]
MSPQGELLELSKEFEQSVGPQARHLLGYPWPTILETLGMDDAGQIQQAMDRKESITGVNLNWPVSNAAMRVPLSLSAHPIKDDSGQLLGYSGFGVIQSIRAYRDNSVVDPVDVLVPLKEDEPAAVESVPEPQHETPSLFDLSVPAPAPVIEEEDEAEVEHVGLTLPNSADCLSVGTMDFDLNFQRPSVDKSFEAALDEADAEQEDLSEEEIEEELAEEIVSEDLQDDEPVEPADDTEFEDTYIEETEPQAEPSAFESSDYEVAATLEEPLKPEVVDTPKPTKTLSFADVIAGMPDAPARRTPGTQPRSIAELTSNIVRFMDRAPAPTNAEHLSKPEKDAFNRIAEALGKQRIASESEQEAEKPAATPVETLVELQPANDEPLAEITQDVEEPQEDSSVVVPLATHAQIEAEFTVDNYAPAKVSVAPIDPRLLDRLPIGVAIVKDRDVYYANDTLLNQLGYDELEELSNAGGLEAIFADSHECPEPPTETVDRVMHVRLAKGGVKPADARLHSVPWNGTNALMISLIVKESVEAPREAASVTPIPTAAMERSEEGRVAELESALEIASDGIFTVDRQGRILDVNRAAEKLFGAEWDDMVASPLTAYLDPESHRSALDYLESLVANGLSSILSEGRELTGRRANGSLVPLHVTMGRVKGTGAQRFTVVLRDISKWKVAEEELSQAREKAESASAQKSEFLSTIGHEIRTPLNAIIGFAEVMLEERFGDLGSDRYKEYLRDIERSGSHILSLLNDLLDLSKIEAGKMELAFEAVAADEILRECVALLQPQANRERILMRTSLPTDIPRVVADPRKLRQITLNLLSNAIKYNRPGGQVIVSLSSEPTGEVKLRVRDTGEGMSAADLNAAMEPFRQLNPTMDVQGTGLGLPLTKAMTEANRAIFSIESEEGVGTLVEITFPPQRVLTE